MGKRKIIDAASEVHSSDGHEKETKKKSKKEIKPKTETVKKTPKKCKQTPVKSKQTPVKSKKTLVKSKAEKDGGETKPNAGKSKSKSHPKLIDETDNNETEKLQFTEPLAKKNSKGQLVFPDVPEFRPNMTPKEVLQAGSFGGTYFRPIKSSITGKSYSGVWKELPQDWLEGLNIGKQVSCPTYDEKVNTYGVKCGGSLQMWEESGWIHKQDPYGWFQWYCRFYQGRRTSDDERQIGRWLRCAGETGRWRNNLISKCVKSGCGFDNAGVSPVVRQTLQHWGYRLSKEDFDAYHKKMVKKGQA